ncbi:MAG: sodium:proton antiporter NhaD [Cyclobacteriaceae bacterium]|nr:sodium:proton antiporter NhaD [Cyclobacteriaceae bacterium]
MEIYIIIIFVFGYLAIALEHSLKINKTATALVTGVLCWTLFALKVPNSSFLESHHFIEFSRNIKFEGLPISDIYHSFINSELSHNLSQIASIIFFLIGAMTIVELIDAHQGFRFITERIRTKDIRQMLWIICWVTFFLSAILDNLTTAIVMVSLVRKLIQDRERRLLFAGMIIIAANAGGAWSPIGDITTTMLWIGGQISPVAIIKSLLIPSIVSLLVPVIFLSFTLKGTISNSEVTEKNDSDSRGGKIMLLVGVGALVFVPVFKTLTHLPPYVGILLGLGVLWIVSEMINPHLDEDERKKYSAGNALSRIDTCSVLFFFGILLAVGALESMQTLHHFAEYLEHMIGDKKVIITLIGVFSSIIDNVPLVAACMGMYSVEAYPMDHMIWEYLAYCAGTGGSLLVIGSAAGVAVMGMEKMDFIWYFRKITFLALLGYAAGAAMFLIMN